MAYVLERVSIDAFYSNILLGLFKILEKNPRISNIKLERQQACTSAEILTWEQLNCVRMPEDLRNFYLAINGFKCVWSYNFGQEILEVGNISICSLQDLILLTGYTIKSPAQITIVDQKYHLQLSAESKVLQLSQIDEDSKICLVYLNSRSNPTIWLADEELKWHYLTNKFTQYFQMAIVHLGLPYWQFCFTPQGVPSWVEQIMLMEAQHLMKDNMDPEEKIQEENYYNSFQNQIDFSIFKVKRNSKSQENVKYKRKTNE